MAVLEEGGKRLELFRTTTKKRGLLKTYSIYMMSSSRSFLLIFL
jgi:hypothetical protein